MNYKKTASYFIWTGIILLILVFLILIFKEYIIDFSFSYSNTGAIGSLLGGLIGPIWGLAGILLIFQALSEQQEANKISLESYHLKNKEYEKSLISSNMQLKNFEIQRFETSFANLINVLLDKELNAVISNTNQGNSVRIFDLIYQELVTDLPDELLKSAISDLAIYSDLGDSSLRNLSQMNDKQIIIKYLENLNTFRGYSQLKINKNLDYKHILNRYTRFLNRVIRFIIENSIDSKSKEESVKTLKSILDERQIWFYYNLIASKNCYSDGVREFEYINITQATSYQLARDIGLFEDMNYLHLTEYQLYKTIMSETVAGLASSFNNCFSSKSDYSKITRNLGENEFIKFSKKEEPISFTIQVENTFQHDDIIIIKSIIPDIYSFYREIHESKSIMSWESDSEREIYSIYCTIEYENIEADEKAYGPMGSEIIGSIDLKQFDQESASEEAFEPKNRNYIRFVFTEERS